MQKSKESRQRKFTNKYKDYKLYGNKKLCCCPKNKARASGNTLMSMSDTSKVKVDLRIEKQDIMFRKHLVDSKQQKKLEAFDKSPSSSSFYIVDINDLRRIAVETSNEFREQASMFINTTRLKSPVFS